MPSARLCENLYNSQMDNKKSYFNRIRNIVNGKDSDK